MNRKERIAQARRTLDREKFRRCLEELKKAERLFKARKYHQAFRGVCFASEFFNSLPYDEQQKQTRLESRLQSLYKSSYDGKDEPDKIPRAISLEEAQSMIKSSKLEMIGHPVQVLASNKTELPIYVGHRIEKDETLKEASVYLVGEKRFTGETESGYDNYGHSNSWITREEYTYTIQLFRILINAPNDNL
jgi:hypothetical protein